MKTTITRCLTLGAAIFPLSTHLLLAQAPPATVVTAEPEVNGKLVCLPVALQTQFHTPSYMFGLRLDIRNTSSSVSIRWQTNRIEFTYPSGKTTTDIIERDVVIAAGKTSRPDYLEPKEVIQLLDPPPTHVRMELYFKGYSTPLVFERDMAVYSAPTPSGTYLFPGSAADFESDELWTHVDPHSGGVQLFAYDLQVVGWDEGKNAYVGLKPSTDGTQNDDYFGWGKPLYAMADGTVLWVRSDYANNPKPKTRAIQHMGDVFAGPIDDVKVTRLKDPLSPDPFSGRVVTAATDGSGNLGVTVWDLGDDGVQITQRGSGTDAGESEIDLTALSGTRWVTATGLGTDSMRLRIWDVSGDGMTVTRQGRADVSEPVAQIAAAAISGQAFATAAATEAGDVHLMLWQVATIGSTPTPMLAADAYMEPGSSPSIVSLVKENNGLARLAVSFRAASGQPKVIVWDVTHPMGTTYTLTQKGANTITNQITRVALVARTTSTTSLLTAMRTPSGDLKVLRWAVSGDGATVTPEGPDFEAEAPGPFSNVFAAAPCTDDTSTILTTMIKPDGTLSNFLWTASSTSKSGGTALDLWGEAKDDPVTAVSVAEFVDQKGLMVGAVRTDDGDLRVITWRVARAGGNEVRILHGDCRVIYAHMRQGSIDTAAIYPGATVKAGQFLGRMGNSGQSTGPHTHIHAEAVDQSLTVAEMIDMEARNDASYRGLFRPILFRCATARRLKDTLAGGPGNPRNDFSPVTAQGFYFAKFAIYPYWKPEVYVDTASSCPLPGGFRDCGKGFWGPYLTVNQALSDMCWGRDLYIRVGTYNESVLFDRSMIVRSYDGPAVIGAP